MLYDPEAIRDHVARVLVEYGYSRRRAEISARVLVEGDMRGVFSHGVNGLDLLIIPCVKAGCTVPTARCREFTRDKRYCVRHIDAGGAPGHATSVQAVRLVKGLARRHGMGRVFVYNASHFGAAGIYSEAIAAEKDLEGRVACTSTVHAILPGGDHPALGTNPIAQSIPFTDGIVTLDMATTVHAASAIARAIAEDARELPFAVYDGTGRLTTDPRAFADVKDFVENGSIPHLGTCLGPTLRPKDDVYYKGMGLGILVALLCSTSGSPLATVTASVHDERRRVVHLFEAARIDTLFRREKVLARVAGAVAFFRRMGPDLQLPGEIETTARARAVREGIPYADEQIERLVRAGKKIGLAVPDRRKWCKRES